MSEVTANELKKKMHILVNGQPCTVLEVQIATPTARGASSLVKVRARNLISGYVQDLTFKTGDKFSEPDVEKSPASFLYQDQEGYHFMDNSSYEEFAWSAEKLGDQRLYLSENLELQVIKFNGSVISIELPAVVELTITETDPPIKGASSSGRSTKRAKLETCLEVQVPLYIESGVKVRVNTETGEVSGRA